MVDPSSGRATLLESIRQAGGIGKAKLRSVKERKLEKKKQKEQEQGEAPLPLQPGHPVEACQGPKAVPLQAGCSWRPGWPQHPCPGLLLGALCLALPAQAASEGSPTSCASKESQCSHRTQASPGLSL